jgi:hypothetical protein
MFSDAHYGQSLFKGVTGQYGESIWKVSEIEMIRVVQWDDIGLFSLGDTRRLKTEG